MIYRNSIERQKPSKTQKNTVATLSYSENNKSVIFGKQKQLNVDVGTVDVE